MEQQPDLFATFEAVFIVLAILFGAGIIVLVLIHHYKMKDSNDDSVNK
jgi:preprotein translocase subunit SecG